jgi:hypothetical protein
MRGAVSGSADAELTQALCIRCGQHFEARSSCPLCGELVISIQMGDEEEKDPWLFEIVGADGASIATAGGFPTSIRAQDAAHEFLRRYVGLRRRRKPAAPIG